jgi:hypothetical protein
MLVGSLLASVRPVDREEEGPSATVIKAFNAMYATYLRPNPRHREGRQVVFYAGDDNAACEDFDQLISGLGFAPVRVGGLRDGGKLMQLGGPFNAPHVLKPDSPVAAEGQGGGM